MAGVGFSSYAAQIVTAYGIKAWPVFIVVVLPGLVYAPTNLPAFWFFARYKVHQLLICAALMQVLGGWIRTLSFVDEENYSGTYWMLVFGQFIFFVANPFILNSISIIANMWFAEEERARAMAIAGLMAPLGSLLGLGLAGIIIIGLDVDDPIECMNHLKKIVYAQNTIFTITVALLLILMREKPVDPPSKTALTFRVLS